MKKIYLLAVVALFGVGSLHAQNYANTVQSTLEFMNIPMDARAAGMGDLGVATTPDGHSHQYNPSKYLFDSSKAGAALTYSPWMRNLVKDMNISSVTGYYKLDDMQSISASFKYFSLGDMVFMDDDGRETSTEHPYELTFDAAYARKLSENFGLGVTFRYALSNIFPSIDNYSKGWAITADIGAYYHKPTTVIGLPSLVTAGASIGNIGTKVSYVDDGASYFMPMALKLGAGITSDLDDANKLMLGLELSRSLVPTSTEDLDKSSLSGMFASLGEGNFRSVAWSFGAEYSFNNMFYARAGYYYQDKNWGNRQNFTFGAGVKYKIIYFNAAYLVPTSTKHNPMGNTLRLSIAVDI